MYSPGLLFSYGCLSACCLLWGNVLNYKFHFVYIHGPLTFPVLSVLINCILQRTSPFHLSCEFMAQNFHNTPFYYSSSVSRLCGDTPFSFLKWQFSCSFFLFCNARSLSILLIFSKGTIICFVDFFPSINCFHGFLL